MAENYSSMCDDFFADMYINTELDLPSERDIILGFFERLQRRFPNMGSFFRRENGDFTLEEDRSSGSYNWVSLEIDRICCGSANQESMESASELQKEVISLIPYMLGVTPLDVDSVDLSYTLSFDFQGNQDEVISEALYCGTSFNKLLEIPGSSPIGFGSNILYSLSEDCRTQLRINIDSKTSVYEVRSGNFSSAGPISIVTTVRQYPKPNERFDLMASYTKQQAILEEVMYEKVVPYFLKPISDAIAYRR